MRISGVLALIAIVVGCGGDGPSGGGNNDGPVASVQINGSGDMTIGQDRQLTAQLRNAQNQVLTGRTIAWSVDPAGIVSLSATSGATITVSAEDEGTATVTATSEGVSDEVDIEVAGAPATAVVNAGATTWSPATVSVAVGGKVTFNNNSGTLHTLEFDAAGLPDDGNFANGESVEVTFTTATGSPFAYHCSIHAGMNGTVVVVP